MGWFARWRLNRAARQYARRLPSGLRPGWGRSKTYTQGQIDAAVRKVGLDPGFLLIGYAAFLPAEELAGLQFDAAGFTSSEAKAAFERWRPVVNSRSFGEFSEAGGAGSDGDYDSGGHHGGHGHGGGH